MNFSCKITGCDFLDPAQGRWAHGDLHRVGDCWVFNAVLRKGETAWTQTGAIGPLRIAALADWWERRGVLVVPCDKARLSVKAILYISKWEI